LDGYDWILNIKFDKLYIQATIKLFFKSIQINQTRIETKKKHGNNALWSSNGYITLHLPPEIKESLSWIC